MQTDTDGDYGTLATWVDESALPATGAWPNDDVQISNIVTYTGNLSFAGGADLVIDANKSLVVTGDFTMNGGNISIGAGATLTITGNLSCSNPGVLSNAGTFTVGSIVSTASIDYDFINTGDFNCTGAASINGDITQTSGTMDIDGLLTLHGGGQAVNINGGTSTFNAITVGSISTTLTVAAGQKLTVTNDFTNAGSGNTTVNGILKVGGNATMTGSGDIDVGVNGQFGVTGTLAASGSAWIIIGWCCRMGSSKY